MDAEAMTVSNLSKTPSYYNGQKITFTCVISGFARDSSGDVTAVNCHDPNDFMAVVQVDTIAFDMTKINQSDTVRFYAKGMGSATGKNAFGGDVTEALAEGLYINDLTTGYKE